MNCFQCGKPFDGTIDHGNCITPAMDKAAQEFTDFIAEVSNKPATPSILRRFVAERKKFQQALNK